MKFTPHQFGVTPVIQVPEKENSIRGITKEDLKLLNSETFQLTHF